MSELDTDLERRVVATLQAKADQLDAALEPFDEALSTTIASAKPHRRRLLVAATFAAVLVLTAALLVIVVGRGGENDSTVPAIAPVVARLEIDALPNLTFRPAEITTRPGLNEITFRSLGGYHDLVFADPALRSFHLLAPGTDVPPAVGDAPLEAGRDYVVYCSIPGHREAGQETVIHVTGDPK